MKKIKEVRQILKESWQELSISLVLFLVSRVYIEFLIPYVFFIILNVYKKEESLSERRKIFTKKNFEV